MQPAVKNAKRGKRAALPTTSGAVQKLGRRIYRVILRVRLAGAEAPSIAALAPWQG